MRGFLEEDVALATHADLPPLLSAIHQAPPLYDSTKRVLKACLERKLQATVREAQGEGWLADDEELSTLPAFKQSLADDALHIQRAAEEERARAAARQAAAEEAARAEADRQRAAAEAAAADAARRRDANESRRLARLQARREERERIVAEEHRRYESLRSQWEETVRERQERLEEVEGALSAAEERKSELQARMEELASNKAALLKQLRDMATRNAGQGSREDGGAAAAGMGGSEPTSPRGAGRSPPYRPWERDAREPRDDGRHGKRPRDHSPPPGAGGGYGPPPRRPPPPMGDGFGPRRSWEMEGDVGPPPRRGPGEFREYKRTGPMPPQRTGPMPPGPPVPRVRDWDAERDEGVPPPRFGGGGGGPPGRRPFEDDHRGGGGGPRGGFGRPLSFEERERERLRQQQDPDQRRDGGYRDDGGGSWRQLAALKSSEYSIPDPFRRF